jgi:hypothetical protein
MFSLAQHRRAKFAGPRKDVPKYSPVNRLRVCGITLADNWILQQFVDAVRSLHRLECGKLLGIAETRDVPNPA